MMLKPAITQIISDKDSYYTFVVAVAKKAREIAQAAEENKEPLEEKPVKLAVDLFAEKKIMLPKKNCM